MPAYQDLFPYQLPRDFSDADIAENHAAIQQQQEADDEEQDLTTTKEQVFVKLQRELQKQFQQPLTTRLEVFDSNHNAMVADRMQISWQLGILKALIREEKILTRWTYELRKASTPAQNPGRISSLRKALDVMVRNIYRNRANHDLSLLLVPRDGTDPTRVTAIAMMPKDQIDLCNTKVLGFPFQHA